MSNIPVWIDFDTGVDDSGALLLANRLEALEIVGISAVAGNVELEKTTRNALKICDLMGANYPVYPGASQPWRYPHQNAYMFHGEDGLGGAVLPEPSRGPEKEAAWDALFHAAKVWGGKLEVVAVGPLTNIATALVKYPQLKELIHRILIMGGAAVGGNTTPAAEFNIYADPDAAQTVFRSGVPVVMCGLDVTLQAYLTREEIAQIGAYNTPVTRYFHDACQRALNICTGIGLPGISIHDACPLLYLAKPEIFEGEEAGVYVETQAVLTRGKTVTDLYSDHQFEKKNTLVLLKIDRNAFVRIMMDALRSY